MNFIYKIKAFLKTYKIIVILVILIIILSIVLVLIPGRKKEEQPQPSGNLTPTPKEESYPSFISQDIKNWYQYKATNSSLSFRYPNIDTATVRSAGSGVQLQVLGKQQLPNTELTDGFSLYFEIDNLNGKSLDQIIQEDEDQINNTAQWSVISEKRTVEVGDYKAYAFTAITNGVNERIYAQNGDKYIRIYKKDQDPLNLNYDAVTTTILKTLSF
jgi:hypothetical protein